MAYCTDSIITTLSLYRNLSTAALIAIEIHHGYQRAEVLDALETLIVQRRVGVRGDSLHLLEVPHEEIPADYLRTADEYRRVHHPTWRDRIAIACANAWARFMALFDRIVGGVVLLVVTTFFTIGLCASDLPDRAAVGRWTTAEVTAYCPCALCCGDSADGITADGTLTRRVPYAFAADRSLPFGARVFVPLGLGVLDVVRADDRWFRIDDRGGALDTEARRYGVLRLDLRVREHWWAVRFGRRVLPVLVSTNH